MKKVLQSIDYMNLRSKCNLGFWGEAKRGEAILEDEAAFYT
jgi:hypothetical protein